MDMPALSGKVIKTRFPTVLHNSTSYHVLFQLLHEHRALLKGFLNEKGTGMLISEIGTHILD